MHRQRLSALLASTSGDQLSKKSGLHHSTAATAQTANASPFDLAKNSRSVVAGSLFSQSKNGFINVKRANPLRIKGKRVEEPSVESTTYTRTAAARKSSAAVATRRPLYADSPVKKITIKSPSKVAR